MIKKNIFLFSIDVEDDRCTEQDNKYFSGKVPSNTKKYLNLLKAHKMKSTFFVLGNIARKYPELLRQIEDEGHEIACHSNMHIPLTQLDEKSFTKDLEKNISAIIEAGVSKPIGYRAPCFSMTDKTQWAYKVLEKFNFTYSSSVLPAKNPHYGWNGFGEKIKKYTNNIWEVPVSLSGLPIINIPFAGGVYFRSLPFPFVMSLFKKHFKQNKTIVSYFHPYDIDPNQPKNAFPEFSSKPFFNWLMYYNRTTVLDKLNKVINSGAKIVTYKDYLSNYV